MPRTAGQEAIERAERAFERMCGQFAQECGLKGEVFKKSADGLSLEPNPSLLRLQDGVTFVRPERRAHGLVFHVSIGTFVFFVSVLEPWEATLSLTATIVLGDHRGIRRADLLSRLVDPERRIGLGPWYEVAADFVSAPTPHWYHGFYGRRSDERRSRLDHIWRRQEQRIAAKPYSAHEEILFEGLRRHFLSRKTF